MPAALDPSHPTFGRLGPLLFLGAVWGGAFLAFRIAAPEVGAVWAAEIRIAIGAVALLAIAGRRTWAAVRRDPVGFTILGMTFSAIPFTLLAFASLTLPTGFGALLNATTPLFTALLAVAWLGQRLSGRVVAGLGVGIVAVAILVGWAPVEPDLTTGAAIVAALGAATSYAVAGTFVRRRMHGIGGLELSTGQLVFGAIVLLPVALVSGEPGTPSPSGLVALLAVGILSTALPWPVFHRLLARTGPTAASTVTFVVPAFAMLWGALVLGEPVGLDLILGFAAIVVSLVLVVGISLPILGRRPTERRAAAVQGPA